MIQRLLILVLVCLLGHSIYGQRKYPIKQLVDTSTIIYIEDLLSNLDTNENITLKITPPITPNKIWHKSKRILFKYYGRWKIKREYPILYYQYKNLICFKGTMYYTVGGTFIMVFDTTSNKILYIIAGK